MRDKAENKSFQKEISRGEKSSQNIGSVATFLLRTTIALWLVSRELTNGVWPFPLDYGEIDIEGF